MRIAIVRRLAGRGNLDQALLVWRPFRPIDLFAGRGGFRGTKPEGSSGRSDNPLGSPAVEFWRGPHFWSFSRCVSFSCGSPSRFLSDESEATAIEYGLIAAGISLLIIGAANNIGTKLNTTFTSIRTQLN